MRRRQDVLNRPGSKRGFEAGNSISDVHAALQQRVGGVPALDQDPSLRHASRLAARTG